MCVWFGSGFLNKFFFKRKKKKVTKVILPQICLTITSKQMGSLLSPRLWLSRMLPHFNRQGPQSRNYINWRKGIFVHLLHSQSCLHIRDFTLKIYIYIYIYLYIFKKKRVIRFRGFVLILFSHLRLKFTHARAFVADNVYKETLRL